MDISQDFTAGDDVAYETRKQNDDGDWLDEDGNIVADVSHELLDINGDEPYLPFNMKDPHEGLD